MDTGVVREFQTCGYTATRHHGVAGFHGVASSLPAKFKVNTSYLISTIILTIFYLQMCLPVLFAFILTGLLGHGVTGVAKVLWAVLQLAYIHDLI